MNNKHTKEKSCDDCIVIFESNESIIIHKEQQEHIIKREGLSTSLL